MRRASTATGGAIEGGAAGLFTKPIDFPELRQTIDKRLAAIGGAP